LLFFILGCDTLILYRFTWLAPPAPALKPAE
jgi:hypothetical protein